MNTTSQLCSCTSLFYDNLLNEQCVSCPYRCLTCNALGCLTCNASLFRQLSSIQCLCMNGYFDDNANGLCQRCDSSCSTCNSLVECSSCNSFLQRYMDVSTGKQLCLCAPRHYSVVGVEECMFCWTTCVTCNGPSDNNCLTCDTAKNRELSVDKKCVCKAGYF
jgi:proprotein convertase subtilisin/kexin type 5